MAFTWKSNLETGNTAIDSQHKELIQAANNLLDACSLGKGKDTIEETGLFLLNYTKTHFRDEEKLQASTNYPDFENHKKMHLEFETSINTLLEDLRASGPNIVLVAKFNNLITGWLFNHIIREDTKIANHIKNK